MKVSVVPTVNGRPPEQSHATPPRMGTYSAAPDPASQLPPAEPPVRSTVPPSNYPTPGQTLNAQAVQAPTSNFHVVLLMQWQSIPYAELSVLASWLRALSAIHQSHHWQCQADPFYGDHLLYDRLYHQVNEAVDRVAEKAVGVGCSDLADPLRLSKYTSAIVEAMYLARPGIPQATDLAVRSLYAEKEYLKAIDLMAESLESKGLLTRGVDNMLADLADEAEGRIYQLKQRLAL